ncbi:MAG: hypothetical protein PHO14_03420 [Kiritimatiellae bacterium]|jgi:type II secretory pathway pseudopilin PulG|nr:hypothetical protein [Kiritimatiellia bacterium]MDD4341266.1 hypothetical protein [Kiritimatiellia bacterium]MDY0149872.1 hypothetical protein [Kiritimatiellia bacterium]
MKIAPRELNLLAATVAVVILAVTYLALEPKFQEWADFAERRADLVARRESAQHLLDSRESVESRLAEFRDTLPVFPAGQQAEAELLLTLEKSLHGLILTRSEAEPEREADDLFETGLTCYWEGDLSSLVNFLFAQQAQGAVSDIRQLSIQPASGRDKPPGRLRGTFTIDYAYRRQAEPVSSSPEPTTAPPSAADEQP